MNLFDIRSLVRTVVASLEASGIARENQISVDIDRSIPVSLSAEVERIRQIFYVVLSAIVDPDGAQDVRISILPQQSGGHALTVLFRTTGVRFDRQLAETFVEEAGGSIEVAEGADDSAAGYEIRCRLPVSYPAEADSPATDDDAAPPLLLSAVVHELRDPSLALRLLREYVLHLERQIDRIEAAITARDAATVHREAHSIRGGALNIHAQKLREAAYALETEAKEGTLANAPQKLETIRQVYREIAVFIHSLSEGNEP